MNERLEQLRLDASRYAKEQYPNDIVDWSMCMSEKFAELIVRECAKRSVELGQPEIGEGIMKHFGVKQ